MVVDHGIGFAGAWPEDTADLLEVEAEGVGGAEQDGPGDRRDVGTLGDDVAGGEHLQLAGAEVGDGAAADAAVHGAVESGGGDALSAEGLGDGFSVSDGAAEGDGGAVVDRLNGAAVVGDGVSHGLPLAEDLLGLLVTFAGVVATDAGQVDARRCEDPGADEEALLGEPAGVGAGDEGVELIAEAAAVEPLWCGGDAEDVGPGHGGQHLGPGAGDGMVGLVDDQQLEEVGRDGVQPAGEGLDGCHLHALAEVLAVAGGDDAVVAADGVKGA